MKWLKENWGSIVLILLIGAVAFIIFKDIKAGDYKDQITIKNDSIEVLNDQIQSFQIALDESQDLFVDSENDNLLYQDSLDRYRATIYRNKKNYEAAIIDLITIPTDTMYRAVAEWLDGR